MENQAKTATAEQRFRVAPLCYSQTPQCPLGEGGGSLKDCLASIVFPCPIVFPASEPGGQHLAF